MKILQADDHPLFRDGARYILSGLCEEEIIIVESHDFSSTAQKINEHKDLDLVLLDLDMPGMQSTSGLCRLVEMFPTLPIVVLSASERPHDIENSLKFGAAGFVPKSSPSHVLLAALKLVLGGGIYAPRTNIRVSKSGRQRDSTLIPSKRQLEILNFIADGMPNKAIANRLFLAESTIKGHVRGLLQLLEVNNRVQAINKARELGFLSPL